MYVQSDEDKLKTLDEAWSLLKNLPDFDVLDHDEDELFEIISTHDAICDIFRVVYGR